MEALKQRLGVTVKKFTTLKKQPRSIECSDWTISEYKYQNRTQVFHDDPLGLTSGIYAYYKDSIAIMLPIEPRVYSRMSKYTQHTAGFTENSS